jgi:Ca-activated chloride channel family protein
VTVLAAVLLAVAPLVAEAPQSPGAVAFSSPQAGIAAFGELGVEVEVGGGEAVRKIEIFLDGRHLGTLSRPPYRIVADFGQENVEHTLRAVARFASGATREATLVTPKIKVDQEVTFALQQLYVSVVKDGKRVLDLTREDFKVFDDGEEQEIRAFGRGDIPLAAVVLLDSSLSMQGERLHAALAGAQAFFSDMRQLDEGKLLVYSDHIVHATPFTNVPEVLRAGLSNITPEGGTALADHLYLALKLLEEQQGRRVVVLLSDGVDSHSLLAMEDVLFKARQSQALIYWIRLADQMPGVPDGEDLPPLFTAWRDKDGYWREFRLLKRTVEESGGNIAAVTQPADISAAFRAIMRELRDQYVLGYYPAALRNNGRWRRVKVKVDRPRLDVLTREGYLDF